MRHKALPLPGQLALDFAVTEVEPGLVEVGQPAPASPDEIARRPVEARIPEPFLTSMDEGCDALA